MTTTSKLIVTTTSDTEIAMIREFDAPRRLVYKAITTPDLIKRWLSGVEGWVMSHCEMDATVGGHYRYIWTREADGVEMGMGGTCIEVIEPVKLAMTEKFDDAWYPGEAIATNTLVEVNDRTTLTLSVKYETQEARDTALQGMEDGVAVSYDRLEELLKTMAE
jgi:uncharacterized protein YndB with AHSA1/START domain